MAQANFKAPNEFDPGTNPAQAWINWRQKIEIYWTASELSTKEQVTQNAILIHLLGEQAIQIFNLFEIDINDANVTVNQILDKFGEYYKPYKNETYLRYVFFTSDQTDNQTVDQYLTDLKLKAKDCGFEMLKDSLIRDKLITGVSCNNLRKKLLQKSDLTLPQAIDICRADEEAKKQTQIMQAATIPKVDSIAKKYNGIESRKKYNEGDKQEYKNQKYTDNKNPCTRCGYKHEFGKCPAWGRRCNKCKKEGHLAKVCKNKNIYSVEESKMGKDEESSSDEEYFKIQTIKEENETERKEWKVMLKIDNQNLNFKIDTGSEVNTIPWIIIKSMNKMVELQPVRKGLVSYSNHKVETVGKCVLPTRTKERIKLLEYYVTKENNQPIIGLQASLSLDLIKRTYNIVGKQIDQCGTKTTKNILEKYYDVFEGLGCLKRKYDIKLVPEAKPVVARNRKIPLGMRERVKNELSHMEKIGIITKITEPTEWVHPIVIKEKPENKVRICMDPLFLNKHIMREHRELPTVEEILAKLAGARFFTVLDVTKAFHQIPLTKRTSKVCTIITPFGRYRYNRLPYGIASATEIFQSNIEEIIEGLEGTMVYTDDVIIYGETLSQHNERLEKFLKRARESNLKLNKKKIQLAINKINYLGHEISDQGITITKSRIEAAKEIKPPKNIKELQSFLGMINQFRKFIKNLSEETAILRELLKKETKWTWESAGPQEECFNKLKTLITSMPVLAFYDQRKEITMAVDASQYGLGGVMTQNGRPVAYCSSALNETQRKYAQIEKELLAIVTACKHFHYYIYGKRIKILTDHKPLIGIKNKPVDTLSPRLQRLVLELIRYDVELEYIQGKNNYTADVLSRNPRNKPIITDKLDNIGINTIIIASERVKTQIEETKKDPVLKKVIEYVKNGWPKGNKTLQIDVKRYYEYKLELYYDKNVLYKGQAIVIPKSLRKEVLEATHKAHQGVNSCVRRARQSVFWPGMDKEIKDWALGCLECKRYSRANQRQPLQPYQIPELPWMEIGIDFVKVHQDEFLLVVDYMSKFVEISKMKAKNATEVQKALKGIFKTHGIPVKIHSDNGPPFDSHEMKNFANKLGIRLVTSSPLYAQSNGMVERHIQTIKNYLKKSNEEPYMIQLIYNTTPKDGLPSPSEILMGRSLRNNIITTNEALKPKYGLEMVKKTLGNRQQKQAKYYNQGKKILQPLEIGKKVMLREEMRKWSPATIVGKEDGEDSYKIRKPNGQEYRRNRIYIRPIIQREEDKDRPTTNGREEVAPEGIKIQSGEEEIKLKEGEEIEEEKQTREPRMVREKRMPKKYEDYVL